MKQILVIKLGALGDFFLSFGPFAAIRAHHPADRITLLTTAPFAELADLAPWFDRVVIDTRPSWWNLPGLWQLRRDLGGFDFVYDLQTSSRSSHYHRLAGRPPWSGIAWGASHPHANTQRDHMHTIDRQRDQLAMAGIPHVPPPDTAWLRDHPTPITPPPNGALLVPGAAPHRPAKRWPAESFGALASMLCARGFTPMIAGAAADAPLARTIRKICPQAIDLTGKTSIPQLAAMAGNAVLAIGNDTGPMHIAATMGTNCLVLFSAESDPALTAPKGPDGNSVRVIQQTHLADLPVARVASTLFDT